jgi:hypothetical protein
VIYSISQDLAVYLKAQECPVRVVYGPERAKTIAVIDERIVIQRDRDSGDPIEAPMSQHRNPRMWRVRELGAVIRVYAKSTATGAGVHDHERRADQIADMLIVGLERISRTRKQPWRPTSSPKLLDDAALQMIGIETWPGVVYEMRIAVARGVFETAWDKLPAEQVDAGDLEFANQTRAVLNGGTPETACGA